MAKGKMQHYRHIVRSDHPPSAVQGVACSVVPGGMIAVRLFSEYAEMPEALELPEGGDGPVRAHSASVVRDFITLVMMTPETAARIADGLREAVKDARQTQQRLATPLDGERRALPPNTGGSP